jgi:hypothetical protein
MYRSATKIEKFWLKTRTKFKNEHNAVGAKTCAISRIDLYTTPPKTHKTTYTVLYLFKSRWYFCFLGPLPLYYWMSNTGIWVKRWIHIGTVEWKYVDGIGVTRPLCTMRQRSIISIAWMYIWQAIFMLNTLYSKEGESSKLWTWTCI